MRSTCLLAGVLVAFLFVATAVPAMAGDDRPTGSEKAKVEKEIKKLTKELGKLEKKLDTLRSKQMTDEHPSVAEVRRLMRSRQERLDGARRRLAGALAIGERANASRARAAKALGATAGARRRAPAEMAQGHMTRLIGALKKLHAADRKLEARVVRLEQQFRRLTAALKTRGPGGAGKADQHRGGPKGPAPMARHGKRGAPPKGEHRGPPQEIVARLERIERMLGQLVGRGHDRARGPRGRQAGARGPQGMKRRGPRSGRGMRGWMRSDRPGQGGARGTGGGHGLGDARGWMRFDRPGQGGARGTGGGHGQGDARGWMRFGRPGQGGAQGTGGGRGPGDGPGRGGMTAGRTRGGGPAHSRMLGLRSHRAAARRGASGKTCPFCGCGGEG